VKNYDLIKAGNQINLVKLKITNKIFRIYFLFFYYYWILITHLLRVIAFLLFFLRNV